MQIRSAIWYRSRRAEFRRPLGDYILPKRKDCESLNAENELRKAEWKARKDRFVSSMEKASQTHLVVDTLIATVAFTAGITMPGGFIGQEDPTLRLSSSHEKHCFQSIYYYKYHSHAAILFCCLYPPIHATIVSRAESWRLFFPIGLTGLLLFHICLGSNGAGICFGHIRCVNAFLGSCHCQFCHRIALLHPGLFFRYRMFKLFTRNIESGFVLDF